MVFLITDFQDTQLTFCWKQGFFPPLKQASDSYFNISSLKFWLMQQFQDFFFFLLFEAF